VVEWQIGVVLGLQVITTTVAKPFLGKLSDRFNRITPIVAGHLIGALALLCLAGGASLYYLVPASLLMGLGVATVTSSTAAFVSELATEGHRGAALGFMSTVMDVGHASGPVITGLLVTVIGYQVTFVLITCVVVVAAFTYAGYMRATHQTIIAA
jgi:MFS family permease